MDSGVGEEVVEVLRREVEAHRMKSADHEDDLGEWAWTVEVAATATICNLIADFSPLKAVGPYIVAKLTDRPYCALEASSFCAS